MNRVNRPLLVISLAIVAFLGIVGFFLNRFQVSRHRDFYFNRAREARDAGDLAQAITQYLQAIRLGKRDYESHSELAQTFLKIPDPRSAYLEGLRAERVEANHLENHRLLAESAMMVGQFNDVQTWANKLLAARPNDSEFLLMRARARLASTEFAQAAEDYEQVLEDPAAPVAAFVELASIYAERLNSLGKGRQVIDRLVEKENAPAANRVEHGSWYLNQHARRSISATLLELQEIEPFVPIASEDARIALERYPDEPTVAILALRAANSKREFQQAVELGEQAMERFPEQRELYVLSAAAALDLGDKEKGAEYLARGLRKFPTDRDLLWQFANLQLERKDFEQAASVIAKLEKAQTPKPQVRYMQARLLAAQKKYLEAIKAFETARTELVSFPEFQKIIDLELATCFAGIGDRAGQIQALRRAAGQNSGFLAAREQLAMALLAAGRVDEATAEYMNIATRDQAPAGAALNLARLLVLQNQAKESSKRSWEQVDSILDKVEAALGPLNDIAVIRAESLMARERVEEARQLLASLPPSDTSFGARILLEVNQRQWQKADELIRAAQEGGFDSVELRRSRAIRAVFGSDPDADKILASLLQTPESWSAEQRAELEKEIMPIALSGELSELTKTIATSILAKDPTYVAARFSILATQLREKDAQGMLNTLSELEKISGQNATWNYGQALTIALNEDASPDALNRAQQFLNNATAQRPDWAEAVALSGSIYDRQKNVDAAITAYDQAIKLGWRRTEEARRLIDLLASKGRFGEADTVIRRLSQSSPALSSSMSRKASEISWRLDDLQRAVEKAEEAARISENADDFLWLSQVRLINKDNAGAELALKRAMELDGANPNVQFAWIALLRRNSRMDEARQASLELESKIDRSVPLQNLRMAEIFRGLGMSEDQARVIAQIDPSQLKTLEEYQRFYTLANDRTPSLRREFLEGLIAQEKSQADPEITPWARRELALQLVNLPGGPQFEQAQKLVAKNLAAQPKSIEDRKILAMISSVQKGTSNPSEAIAMFQELLREGWVPNPDEQFLLGQLFIAGGDWNEGSRYFTQLLNRAEGRNPEHLKRYIRLLLGRKDGTEAELWHDVLRRDGVQDVESAVLLAEIRYQRGQYSQLLRGLLGAETTYPETAWFQATLPLRQRYELINVFATRLKQEGKDSVCDQFVAATETMKSELESAADFPGAFYASQLLARKEYKNSITALEQVIGSASAPELVEFADALLSSDNVPIDQVERLEKLLASVNRPEDAATLRVVIARLYELRGDYSGGERIYRELLAANPKDTVALNNLANLLALKRTKPDEAISLVQQAIAIVGESPMLLDTRAACHLAAGNLPLARKDLEAAVAAYPHPLLRFHLAQAMFEAREFALAKQEFGRALQSGLRKKMLHVLEQPVFDQLVREFQVEPTEPAKSAPAKGTDS
jgi:Tfp pilus assembly protein PilF